MGDSQTTWKIPFFKGFNYGQHIALKHKLARALQDSFPGAGISVTIKEGDQDGFYVSGSRDAADHAAMLLAKRAMAYFGKNVAFDVIPFEQIDEPTAGASVDDSLIDLVEDGLKIVYNATIEDLSSRIADLSTENQRLKSQQGQKPGKPETIQNLVSILAEESFEVSQCYDLLFETVSANDLSLSQKKPAEYAMEKAAEAARQHGLPDWESLLKMECLPFAESGECIVTPAQYQRSKSDRDALLKVVTTAPESVKDLVEHALEAELKRAQNNVDDYESAEADYNRKLAASSILKKAYSGAECEQRERLERLDSARDCMDMLSGANIPVIISREQDCVHVNLGKGRGPQSKYSKDISAFMQKAAKGLPIQESGDGDTIGYSITCADPADTERTVYNRIISMDSQFKELGINFRIVSLP